LASFATFCQEWPSAKNFEIQSKTLLHFQGVGESVAVLSGACLSRVFGHFFGLAF